MEHADHGVADAPAVELKNRGKTSVLSRLAYIDLECISGKFLLISSACHLSVMSINNFREAVLMQDAHKALIRVSVGVMCQKLDGASRDC